MTSKVLVPLDGSKLGELALPWAACLARHQAASIVLAQALPWTVLPYDGAMGGYVPPDYYEEVLSAQRDGAMAYLEGLRAELSSQALKVEVVVQEGAPGTVILNLADELGVDTIVMSTRGRGGLTRAVLGSVALEIVQNALLPVLLVRADSEAAPRTPSFDRLLVPLDGSLLAERALDVAVHVASPDSTLTLVRVEGAPPQTNDDNRPSSGPDAGVDESRRPATEYLDRIAQTQVPGTLHARTDVRLGVPPDQILAAASAHNADVIVMATHGRTGPARWWLGSVTDSVARRADRPVLLVSARALVARVAESYCVGDVMTRQPVTVLDTEPLSVVLRKLLRWRVSGLPVITSQGQLVGFVSEDELIGWHDTVVGELARQAGPGPDEYVRRLRAPVASVMTSPTPAIDEQAPLARATRLLRERRTDRLAVTREGNLVGILTGTDILKAMAARLQAASSGENPSD